MNTTNVRPIGAFAANTTGAFGPMQVPTLNELPNLGDLQKMSLEKAALSGLPQNVYAHVRKIRKDLI